MGKNKRGGADLTRSSHEVRRAKGVVTLILGDFNVDSSQDVLAGLSAEVKSNLSKSVASLTVCSGDTVLFACSGIAIERHGCVTKFLTSGNLADAFHTAKYNKRSYDDVEIEVRHEGSEVYQGFLANYDTEHNFSIVKVKTFLDVNVRLIEHAEGILPNGRVVALGRATSGELMAKSVLLAGDQSESEDFILPTDKITKAWEGGPLFSFDGNFIGMNLFLVMERAFFLTWGTILKHVFNFHTPSESLHGVRFGGPTDETSICHHDGLDLIAPSRDALNKKLFGEVDILGYPKLPKALFDDGMVLVNTFEETFGDIWGTGVWREFGKKASILSRSVVALASFNGEKRVFACTGFFINWNGSMTILTSASLVRNSGDGSRIVENLRIEVKLPSKVCIEGTLEHYSLHYNVALVSVKGIRDLRLANIELVYRDCSRVAAVGRCFSSGAIIAASGDIVDWSGRLDCKFIIRSSCRITKAGIGGPLVNMDGEVVGMNFYSKTIGTPFLLWREIDKILAHFKEKSEVGEVGKDNGSSFWKMYGDNRGRLNRWPVPMPVWHHPDHPHRRYPNYDREDRASKDKPDFEIPPGEESLYIYIEGVRCKRLVSIIDDSTSNKLSQFASYLNSLTHKK